MAYTHRHYSNKYQIELILSAPTVLGTDLSEFITRAKDIKNSKFSIAKITQTNKLKKDYFNKITELYKNKIKDANLKQNDLKVNNLLHSYNKICHAFNKDPFVFMAFKDNYTFNTGREL